MNGSASNRAARALAAATAAGMFVVLVMGATVTNTGSAEGCGRSWPLCNGRFVPEFTVSTAIEFSHRAVTGLESVLVLALAATIVARWRHDLQALMLAGLMVFTLLLQAGLGAGAVMWPQSALMLATHFGVSLIALAATSLSALIVFAHTGDERPARSAPAGLRNVALASGLYVLAVVYLGAYVRHAGVGLACTDWPLCNGRVVPPLEGATGLVFAHRLAALGAVVVLGVLWRRARRADVAIRPAGAAFGLCVLQALSGAMIVWTRLGLFSALAHAAIMGLLFVSLAHVVRRTLQPVSRHQPVAATARRPASRRRAGVA